MSRVVMIHPEQGYKIFPASEQSVRADEGWQLTKITPEAQEEAEAVSERENDRDQDERAAEGLAAEIEAAGGKEKWELLQKRRKAKEAKAKPAAGAAPKAKAKPAK